MENLNELSDQEILDKMQNYLAKMEQLVKEAASRNQRIGYFLREMTNGNRNESMFSMYAISDTLYKARPHLRGTLEKYVPENAIRPTTSE